jgi:hypothetical protein
MNLVNKQEIFLHFNTVYWNQLNYHREKEYRIFVWTSGVLVAVLAGLLITKKGEIPAYLYYGVIGRVAASVGVIAWMFSSLWLQKRERRYGNNYVAVLLGITDRLKGFEIGVFESDGGYSVLPVSWKEWEKQRPQSVRMISSYMPITLLLTGGALLLIWLVQFPTP